MAKANEPTDAQLVSRLKRSSRPRTAAELGTSAARLRRLDGVREAGRVRTGKAGRPAILFEAAPEEPISEQSGVGASPEAASRADDPRENLSTQPADR